jgi:hypothetical protein
MNLYDRLVNRLMENVAKNLVAWLFFLLFVFAEIGNYTEGRDLHQLCDLLGDHVASVREPHTLQKKIDNICLYHETVDNEESP